MNWYIYRSPKKAGDAPLEVLPYEPNDFIAGIKAQKYGSIVFISEEQLNAERKEGKT